MMALRALGSTGHQFAYYGRAAVSPLLSLVLRGDEQPP